jgi:hypothetical protein
MSKAIFHAKYEKVYGRPGAVKTVTIYKAKSPMYAVGDCVRVFNSGYQYSGYTAMAMALGLISEGAENWSSSFKGDMGFVTAMALHENKTENVYAVREPDGHMFLIGEKGLMLIERCKSHLEKELFEI